jgi:hypothetical protein
MADVKNSAFLLGEATLMMVPYADPTPVFELTPDLHSVGMVRNVTLNSESDQVELRKGIMQLLVDSKKSNVKVSLSTEVYEFSAQNVYRSLSLAKTATSTKRGKLKTAVTNAGSATIVITSDPIPGESATAISQASDIPNGSTIMIQVAGVGNDYVLPVRVTANTTTTTGDFTVTAAVPTGMSFPAGSRVWVVNEVEVGSIEEQDFFKVKVVGTLSNNERPLAIVFPKVKVSKGFQLQFDEGNYTSMPFEFSPYFLAGSEVSGRLAEIGTTALAKAYLA